MITLAGSSFPSTAPSPASTGVEKNNKKAPKTAANKDLKLLKYIPVPKFGAKISGRL
jgi:hypothetical protein